jgi:hypothetical protein
VSRLLFPVRFTILSSLLIYSYPISPTQVPWRRDDSPLIERDTVIAWQKGDDVDPVDDVVVVFYRQGLLFREYSRGELDQVCGCGRGCGRVFLSVDRLLTTRRFITATLSLCITH